MQAAPTEQKGGANLVVVETWTGASASCLKHAFRKSNEAFAEHLGVAVRTVANWQTRPEIVPSPSLQEVLDTALEKASEAVRERFYLLYDGQVSKTSTGDGSDGTRLDPGTPPSDRTTTSLDVVEFGARYPEKAADSTVATWHQKPDLTPKTDVQELLDTALERASESARERFAQRLGGQSATFEPEHVDHTDDVGRAAREALEFASWALSDRVDPLILEHVQYELRRIAVDYVHTPLRPVFEDLLRLRDVTFGLVRERPHPKQARELFFLAGTNLLLLAHASQNLGEPGSGMAQARAAAACAEQADHDGLRAWVAGTQALIAEWSRRHRDAVDFARRGQAYAATAQSRVRLASLEARALARAGNRKGATSALDRARRDWDTILESDDVTEFGGLLTFPLAKASYYAGGVLSLIGDHNQAEAAALQAINIYETGPSEERSYGDEALARVDVALARLARDEVDGAEEILSGVLQLPPEQRIQQLRDGLVRVRRALALPRYANSSYCSDLSEALETFVVPRPDRRTLG
ncbi:hypothetical protein GCM10012275_55190 [Longimycelium tulufanense]|uniref:XRE family transcriptional regulator n=2 Tax=Longimycelium tulufanense TaxID=907463 RepID=A0A8J3FWI6_9PSEU|nr:hypothetical protein GCM10012275_55190 [Longimycelium tulufanense]